MKIRFHVLLIACAAFALLTVGGCKEKGPMERTGESLDRATQKTSDAAKDAAAKAEKAAKDAAAKAKAAAYDATK